MFDILVPCIFRGKTPILLKTVINDGTIKKESWELPDIDDHVDIITPEFENIFRKIEKYFTETFENAENKEIEILLDEKYENLFKDVKINLDQNKTSMLLGIFLVAAKEIMKLGFKEDWYSITATGTFKKKESGLVLEGIEDYKPTPEKPKNNKYTGFKTYVDEDANKGKYLYLYINDDKDFAKKINKENKSKNINNIQVEGFSPTNDTLFDILDFVFKLPTLPEHLLDSKAKFYFDEFKNETLHIIDGEYIESPIYRDKTFIGKLDKNSIYIYGPHGSCKSYLAVQFARFLVLNKKIYAPIWIKIENHIHQSAKVEIVYYYEKIINKLIELFNRDKFELGRRIDSEFECLTILKHKYFLIIIDIMDLSGEILDDFIYSMEKIIQLKNGKSRFIFISMTDHSRNIRNLESISMRLFNTEEEKEERKAVMNYFYKISKEKIYYKDNIKIMKENGTLEKIRNRVYNNYKNSSFSVNPLIELSKKLFSYPYSDHNLAKVDKSHLKNSVTDKRKEARISDEVTVRGSKLVSVSSDVEEYIIPVSVSTIGKLAFILCKNIKNIFIPESVTTIEEGAFSCCDRIESITISNSVKEIHANAFLNTKNLMNINVDRGNKEYASINGILFDKNINTLLRYPPGRKINIYSIPDSVTSIDYSAFEGCSNLETVIIPGSLEKIGYRILSDNSNLMYIEVNEKNKEFSSINGVLFDKNIKTLIFYPPGRKIKTYSIPNSVTTIKSYAFYNCSNLETVIIPRSVNEIEFSAFEGINNLMNIEVDKMNEKYTTINGILFDKNINTLIRYPPGKTGKYSLPASLKIIGNSAFSGCSKLKRVNIPDKVEIIKDSAFLHCSNLESIHIPDSVKIIEDFTFIDCINLMSITIPKLIKEINNNIFIGCNKLTNINFPRGIKISRQGIDIILGNKINVHYY